MVKVGQSRRRLDAGEPGTVAAVGNTLQGTGEAVLGLVGEPLLPRVERWWWPCLRWPVPTTATTVAAAGVRSCTETWLELEGERSKALGMLYGALRTCWTRRGDQMVTGAASTASSVTAEVRPWWETELRRGNEGEKRGKRWRSSPRLQRASKRARGRTGDGESTAMVVGARGGRRWHGGDAELPEGLGLVGRKRGSRRSS